LFPQRKQTIMGEIDDCFWTWISGFELAGVRKCVEELAAGRLPNIYLTPFVRNSDQTIVGSDSDVPGSIAEASELALRGTPQPEKKEESEKQ
jgi:hypothetical protein